MRLSVSLFLLSVAFAQQSPRLPSILSRVSEEAEVFAKMAPQVLATETLRQRALPTTGHRRFIPHVEKGSIPPPPRMLTREIISEYGFASLRAAPGAIREFRQVISVDGREVSKPAAARETLAAGLGSDDDRKRKQMLETFEKYGLIGSATDFGQVLLLFTRRGIEDYVFEVSGTPSRLGAENVLVVNFRQKAGTGSLTIFEKRKTLRQVLQGQCWVRESDFVPLRVILISERADAKSKTRDEATVDYAMSVHGVVLPAAVVHRESVNGVVVVENTFQYSPFKRFGAASDIKFTEVGDAP